MSIRTREPHDATVLATRFGGGGHLRAAGCTVKGGIAVAKRQVRKAVREMLEGKLKPPEPKQSEQKQPEPKPPEPKQSEETAKEKGSGQNGA